MWQRFLSALGGAISFLRDLRAEQEDRDFWTKFEAMEREAEKREIERWRKRLKKAGINYDA